MRFNISTALPVAAALMLGFAPLAQAKTVKFSGDFAAENATTTTSGAGHVTGTVNTTTDKVTYKITYSGLSGKVLAAHFHGPAAAGADAGVMLPIPGPYKTGMHGTLKANAATVKAILDGMTYVNLHTKQFAAGEIRAQVTAAQ